MVQWSHPVLCLNWLEEGEVGITCCAVPVMHGVGDLAASCV